MIETLGYLAVVIVVAAGIGSLVSSAFSDYKLSKASLQINDLASAIIKASAADDGYDDVVTKINKCISQTKAKTTSENEKDEITAKDDTVDARECRIIPSTYRVSAGKMYHAFGGEVTIGITDENDYSTGTSEKLTITFAGLNKKQCVELAMKDWLSNKLVDLYAIEINEHSWYWNTYGEDGTNPLPIRRSVVAGTGEDNGQCSSKKSNTIMWIFN